MAGWVGPAIAAGASLIGSMMGRSSAESAENAAMERQQRSEEMQREFAQQGIRWRVADAQAAGIHPLFALGAQIPGFNPPAVMVDGGDGGAALMAQAGQDIGRAIDSTRTAGERVDARLQALSLERAELQNDLLRSQIARLNQAGGSGPPMPGGPGQVLGSGDTYIVEKPMERTPGAPGQPWQEPGAVTDLGFSRTATGFAVVPGENVKQRIEDTLVPEMMWSLRNHLLPSMPQGLRNPSLPKEYFETPPPETWLPPGAVEWRFNAWRQEYQPYDRWGRRVPFNK